MRDELKRRESKQGDDSGHGCGLTTALIGAGIAAIALVWAGVSTFLPTEDVRAVPQPAPTIVVAATPTWTPTAEPTPTVTASPVELPTESLVIDAPGSEDESAYVVQVGQLVYDLESSFTEFVQLMAQPEFANEEWRIKAEQELRRWEDIAVEVSLLAPPPQHNASYQQLRQASGAYAEAASILRLSLEGDNHAAIVEGFTKVADGSILLNQAMIELSKEL
jgi:hypothetical protein